MAIGDYFLSAIAGLNGIHSHDILTQKLSNRPWNYSGRIKPSRYSGEMLRYIRAHGQQRECERRRKRIDNQA